MISIILNTTIQSIRRGIIFPRLYIERGVGVPRAMRMIDTVPSEVFGVRWKYAHRSKQ
jgi:hypothetical protein